MRWFVCPKHGKGANFATEAKASEYADKVVPCLLGDYDPERLNRDALYRFDTLLGASMMGGNPREALSVDERFLFKTPEGRYWF